MSDAIDALVIELQAGRLSASPQPVVSKIDDLILALRQIQAGLAPAGNELANTVYAGPTSGGAALPAFRGLVAADIPGTLGATGFTGLVSPSSTIGVAGTVTNDNAQAGSIGEFIETQVLIGAAVAMTSGVATDIANVVLTAGDWDVSGSVFFSVSAGPVATFALGWLNNVAATAPTFPNKGGQFNMNAAAVANTYGQCLGPMRWSLAAGATIRLGCLAAFGSGTMGGYGYIRARRMR